MNDSLEGGLPVSRLLGALGCVAVRTAMLSPHYFAKAKARFANEPHVHIAHGDSSPYLKELAPALSSRGVLYYLKQRQGDWDFQSPIQMNCPRQRGWRQKSSIGELLIQVGAGADHEVQVRVVTSQHAATHH